MSYKVEAVMQSIAAIDVKTAHGTKHRLVPEGLTWSGVGRRVALAKVGLCLYDPATDAINTKEAAQQAVSHPDCRILKELLLDGALFPHRFESFGPLVKFGEHAVGRAIVLLGILELAVLYLLGDEGEVYRFNHGHHL